MTSMSKLRGARVGLFESRMSTEIGELVRRLGGTPVVAPSVREVPRAEETAGFVDALVTGRFPIVIVLTGAAANAILREAERSGRLDSAIEALKKTTLACRGPKPTAVARRYGLRVDVIPQRPYTTKELLDAMDAAGVTLRDIEVAVAHYGERNTAFSEELRRRGARVFDVCPYEWALPEDVEPLRALARDLAGQVDAVAFTSQIQVRNLFAVAHDIGTTERLTAALRDDVVVASVGPVCADALKHVGITPDVQPAEPKMGPLLMALADYIELTDDAPDDLSI
jgi:uroporphyrinogen-III synthase